MKNSDQNNQMVLELYKKITALCSTDKIPTGEVDECERKCYLRPLFLLFEHFRSKFCSGADGSGIQRNSSRIPVRISLLSIMMISLTAELTLVACFPSETNAELPFLALSSTEQGQLFLVDQH